MKDYNYGDLLIEDHGVLYANIWYTTSLGPSQGEEDFDKIVLYLDDTIDSFVVKGRDNNEDYGPIQVTTTNVLKGKITDKNYDSILTSKATEKMGDALIRGIMAKIPWHSDQELKRCKARIQDVAQC